MSVILNRELGVQGTTGLPRMCAQPVVDVQSLPVWSCTCPYSMCLKILLTAVFNNEWCIHMMVVPSHSASEQGTVGLPRM